MCLVTRQIKPITTKKDLVVFKDVEEGFDNAGICKSLYFYFEWRKNVLNTTDLCVTRIRPYDFRPPDHNNPNNYFDGIAHLFYVKDKRKLTEVSNGFHAVLTKKRLTQPCYSRVKFLIPKGSLIFKDATGLIVSNQMMLL